MNDFAGLNTALTALYAQQRGMDTTGQNITNANTEGYSRQRVAMTALTGPVVPARWSTWTGTGAGVQVTDTNRVRDALLEQRAAAEHGRLAADTARASIVGDVESTFAEPGDSGIQHQLSDVWNGFDDVANNATDTAAREQLFQRASTLVEGFHQAVGAMGDQWSTLHGQAVATVTDVNATAQKVAELNTAIRNGTVSGSSENDLSDQRDLLVQHLAEQTGATVRSGQDGTVDVMLPGGFLVQGGTSSDLALLGPTSLSAVPSDGSAPVSVGWARDSTSAMVTSGTLGGGLEGMNTVLPGYRARLDAVAAGLAGAVNPLHRAGTDQTGTTGHDFFTTPAPPAQVTAATLSLAITSGSQIAATRTAGTTDGDQAAAMAELGSAPGSPDAAYRAMIVGLGVDKQTADRRTTIQTGVTSDVDASRESTSGVNIDEEMTNMLTFQHAYEAAAKYLSAVDGMLDTLIKGV